jgi:hypothetical protein
MTNTEQQKLAAILGMLGSNHAGERAAAALQAEAFRKRLGMTWADLMSLPDQPTPELEPQPEHASWTPGTYEPPPVPWTDTRVYTVVRQCLIVCGLGAIPYVGLLLLLS